MRRITKVIFILLVTSAVNIFAQDIPSLELVNRQFSCWQRSDNIQIQGDLAFIAAREAGLQILDASEPTDIHIVKSYREGLSFITDVCISGDYAFVSDMANQDTSFFRIIDVSDPAEPVLTASYLFEGFINSIYAYNNYAILNSGTELVLLDITDPETPEYFTGWNLNGGISSIEIIDNILYTSLKAIQVEEELENGGILITDISDMENPELVSFCETGSGAVDLKIQGDLALVAGNMAIFYVVDISNAEHPQIIAEENFDAETPYYSMSIGVDACEDQAFFHYNIYDEMPGFPYEGYIVCFDISESDNPQPFQYHRTGSFGEIEYNDGKLYVAHNEDFGLLTGLETGLLQVIDIDDEGRTYYGPGGKVTHVNIINDNLFLISDPVYNYSGQEQVVPGAFSIFDRSDPCNPVELGSLPLADPSMVCIHNDVAFISDNSESRIQIVNIENPEEMEMLNEIPDVYIMDMQIDGNRLHFIQNIEGRSVYKVMDISDAENPAELISFNSEDQSNGYMRIDTEDTLIYLHAYNSGSSRECIEVLNIADPENVATLATYYFNERVYMSDYRIIDHTGYFSGKDRNENTGTIHIVDFSNPNNPVHTGSFNWGGRTVNFKKICVHDSCIFTFDELEGIITIDISDPENPSFHDRIRTDFMPMDLNFAGDYLYVAENTNLGIYRFGESENVNQISSSPHTYDLLYTYPNPFNSMATIRFNLPAATDVRLGLYDMQGRLIRELVNGRMKVGINTISLNCGQLSTGVYVVNLDAGGNTFNRKISLVK